jgi:hypothetical protein
VVRQGGGAKAMMNARQEQSKRDLQPGLSFSIEGAEKEALDVLPDAGMSGGVEEAKPVRINIKRTIAAMQVAASSPYAHNVRPRKRALQKALWCYA